MELWQQIISALIVISAFIYFANYIRKMFISDDCASGCGVCDIKDKLKEERIKSN